MDASSNGHNGDMPLDAIEQARVALTRAAVEATERRDAIKAQLDQAQELVHRYERALKGLEPPQPKQPPKDRAQTEQAKVRAKRRLPNGGDPAIVNAASGYPGVSEYKQTQVLDALRSIGEPAAPSAIADAGRISRATAQNALAHLRARQLVRWSGKGRTGGHLYAPYDWAPSDTSVEA